MLLLLAVVVEDHVHLRRGLKIHQVAYSYLTRRLRRDPSGAQSDSYQRYCFPKLTRPWPSRSPSKATAYLSDGALVHVPGLEYCVRGRWADGNVSLPVGDTGLRAHVVGGNNDSAGGPGVRGAVVGLGDPFAFEAVRHCAIGIYKDFVVEGARARRRYMDLEPHDVDIGRRPVLLDVDPWVSLFINRDPYECPAVCSGIVGLCRLDPVREPG